VKNDLAEASERAARGDSGGVDTFVSSARRNAEKAGIVFTKEQEAEIERIVKLGNTRAVDVNLARASERADRGDDGGVDLFVSSARRNAERAGIIFTKEQEAEIDGIVKLGNTRAIDVKLSKAYERAARGDISGFDLFVSSAGRNAERAGIVFTKEQEEKILAINERLHRK
jgi:GGDEF domain-containing protein